MNILFYTYYEVDPQKGGTERSTMTTARGLRDCYGHNVYSVFKESTFTNRLFKKSVKLKGNFVDDLTRAIVDNSIDVIVNEGDFYMISCIARAIKESKKPCRNIFVHHYTPGDELRAFDRQKIKSRIALNKEGLKNLVRYLLFSYTRKRQERILRDRYKDSVQMCDRVVLLSKRFKDEYLQFAGCEDVGAFEYIPNALSLPGYFDMGSYGKKEKVALIVSRMDETQKKISRALQVWRSIENDENFSDWSLEVVGDGPSLNDYRKFAEQHLKRVKFFGRQNPQSFYERASIFLMTSACEGWGLTITEAQQNACVPVAFNTYSSLPDIIDDGENGLIADADDDAMYEKLVRDLIANTDFRRELAAKAVEKSKQFDPENLIGRWQDLISCE